MDLPPPPQSNVARRTGQLMPRPFGDAGWPESDFPPPDPFDIPLPRNPNLARRSLPSSPLPPVPNDRSMADAEVAPNPNDWDMVDRQKDVMQRKLKPIITCIRRVQIAANNLINARDQSKAAKHIEWMMQNELGAPGVEAFAREMLKAAARLESELSKLCSDMPESKHTSLYPKTWLDCLDEFVYGFRGIAAEALFIPSRDKASFLRLVRAYQQALEPLLPATAILRQSGNDVVIQS